MPAGSDAVLRVGIAGYGVVGTQRHLFIDQDPRMTVVAISDLRHEQRLTNQDLGPALFRRHEEMLEQARLDVLFVCIPPDVAPGVTIDGLEAGLHVFCEKPPGRTVKDVQRVMEVEQQHPQLKLKYGFNHRYHGSVQDALRIVRSGDLGEIINIRGVYGKSTMIPWPRLSAPAESLSSDRYWRTSRAVAGGGILLDQGIHMVDLMRVFAGEFVRIKSFVRNTFWGHDVEDNAYAIMESETGIIAMLHSTATQWRHQFSLDMALSNGSIVLSGFLSSTRSYGQETLTVQPAQHDAPGNALDQTTTYEDDHSWRDEITEFGDSILFDRPIAMGSSVEALKTMELVYQIYCADELWKQRFNLLTS